jgi:hypothetical protein
MSGVLVVAAVICVARVSAARAVRRNSTMPCVRHLGMMLMPVVLRMSA